MFSPTLFFSISFIWSALLPAGAGNTPMRWADMESHPSTWRLEPSGSMATVYPWPTRAANTWAPWGTGLVVSAELQL